LAARPQPFKEIVIMGSTTRTERAIDEFALSQIDEAEASCDDIRLAWLAAESFGDVGSEFDPLWSDR
jgi:hypothetical protein